MPGPSIDFDFSLTRRQESLVRGYLEVSLFDLHDPLHVADSLLLTGRKPSSTIRRCAISHRESRRAQVGNSKAASIVTHMVSNHT